MYPGDSTQQMMFDGNNPCVSSSSARTLGTTENIRVCMLLLLVATYCARLGALLQNVPHMPNN